MTIFRGRIFHLLGVGVVEMVRNLVDTLGDLVGGTKGERESGRLTGSFLVFGPKFPQPGHSTLCLFPVAAEVEAMLTPLPILAELHPK